MLEIRRVLVPTDFSIHAGHALRYAVGLAPQLGVQTILLLHVFELPVMPVPPSGAASGIDAAQLEKMMRESALAALRERAERIDAAGLQVETLASAGAPANRIAEVALEESVDLIVMGTRGRGGLAHVLFGSVAERTLSQAPCPVLTVKATEEESAQEATA